MFVLDCSVTMAWCFEDESNAYAEKVLEHLEKEAAYVPPLWFLEVSNVILIGEKSKRLSRFQSNQFLAILSELNIKCEDPLNTHIFTSTIELARTYQLTSYDAIYLDLALKRKLPLATLDQSLRKASKKAGLSLLFG